MAAARTRLDSLLVERGHYRSRSRAAAAVIAGEVRVEGAADRTPKPGQLVTRDTELDVVEPPPFVSRGGRKLANALDSLGVDPAGRLCLDVGASTGGFTDCLLQRGAEAVTTVDVAYGELHWRLRNHPRVSVLERVNARHLEPDMLPYHPDLVTVDVSFISLTKVLPAVLHCAARQFECLALVKPQFEVGRERVGKGGVVRSAQDRRAALVEVGTAVRGLGYAVLGYATSGLPGPAGNRETFVRVAQEGSPRAIPDLLAAASEAEP
jgi:23S rRNA (cytidine1920-2'-O)/16S rRNA (cytidine1409-2'-O)-methyltransferase